MTRHRAPPRPTRHAIAARLAFMGGEPIPAPPAPRQSKPRAQREAGASDAIKEWRMQRGDVRLWRNNVGAYPLPNGGWLRYGLCTGSADFIGLRSVVVSPAMVGKRIAVFFALETKGPNRVAESHQQDWLDEIHEAGGIAGVARNAQEAEDLLTQWMERVMRDER